MNIFLLYFLCFYFVKSGRFENVQEMAERMGRIAEIYSNWALGKTKVQPKFINAAPVKQFIHHVRIEPPPLGKSIQKLAPVPLPLPPPALNPFMPMHRPPVLYSPTTTTQPPPLYYPTQQIFHFPKKQPEFPRLLQLPEQDNLSLLFPPNASVLPSHMLLPNPNLTPSKEDVMKIATKKQKFGMRPREMYQECATGWCGDGCCPMRQEIQTTIQAQALPGSPTPPHPLVLVLHPSPQQQIHQCSPACQPQCHPQCVSRLQYIQESQFFNTIQAPMCRPDCMPSCHVDCLIIPPERVRCNSFHCQCGAGYLPCAAFTCCMRYPSMVARMKNNAMQKSEEVIFPIEEESEEEEIIYRKPQRYPKLKKFKRDPLTTTTTTTTSTTTPPPTTTSTTIFPPTTPSTTTRAPIPTTTPILRIAPIYPAPKLSINTEKVPFIPAFEVGDLRGRHIIRSENFLDVLSELAQVKLKEDIGEPLSFIDLVTDDVI